MTDKTPAFPMDEAAGRALVAQDSFTKQAVWLPLLAVSHWNEGKMFIDGKTFTDCVIEGPAVLAVMNGTAFDSCAMGVTTDAKTLLFKPLGQKMAGVVGMSNCKFVRCQFVQVGFTGSEELLAELEGGIARKSEQSA